MNTGRYRSAASRPCWVTTCPGRHPGYGGVAGRMVVPARGAADQNEGRQRRETDPRQVPGRGASRGDDAQGLPRIVPEPLKDRHMIRRDVPVRRLSPGTGVGTFRPSPRSSCRARRWLTVSPRAARPGHGGDRLVLRYRGLAAAAAGRVGLSGPGPVGGPGASREPRAPQAGVVLVRRPGHPPGRDPVGHRRLRHDAVHGPHDPASAADHDRGAAAAAGRAGDAAAAGVVPAGPQAL